VEFYYDVSNYMLPISVSLLLPISLHAETPWVESC